jgi:hypothetical protein
VILPASFSEKAAALCRAVAPLDLAGRGCYVVPYSHVADEYPRLAGGRCGGWTSDMLDLTLRPILESWGVWEGRGFACVIRDDWHATEFAALDTVRHELAHGLASTSPLATMTPEENAACALPAQKLDQLSAADEPDAPKAKHATPWFAHEDRFIRAGLHVLYRAGNFGHRTTPQAMSIACVKYGLSAGQRYALALGSEARDREHESFRSILDSPVPVAFDRLWQADTATAV